MSFFTLAVTRALELYPDVNSMIDGDEKISYNYSDISIAVSGPKGLMTPVLRNAQKLSFSSVEQEIKRLADSVRNKTITVDDLTGGTFTISNGGENDDYGGAMKIVGQSSWDNSTNQNVTNYSGVTFRDCIISGTHLTTNGPNAPAIRIDYGHARFINCKIKNNSNTAQNSETYGGVVRIESGSIVDFIGCEVTDNACINNDYSYAWGGVIFEGGYNNSKINIIFTVRDGVEPSSPARNSRETTYHVYQFRHLTMMPYERAVIRRCIPIPPPLLGKKSNSRNSSSSFSTLSFPNLS